MPSLQRIRNRQVIGSSPIRGLGTYYQKNESVRNFAVPNFSICFVAQGLSATHHFHHHFEQPMNVMIVGALLNKRPA